MRHRSLFGFASVLLNPRLDSTNGIHTVDTGMFLGWPTEMAPIGGKGASRDGALAGCVGEGLERFALASVHRGRGVVRTLVAGDGLMAWRPSVDFDGERVQIDQHAALEFCRMEPLGPATGEAVSVPMSLVKAPYFSLDPRPELSVPTPSSTTGAAAGATLAEATLQALLELVERDAFWFAARTALPLVPIGPSDRPQIAAEAGEALGVEVVLRWVPNPLGLPVAHCVLRHARASVRLCARGMGVAPTPAAASEKAVVEAVQMWRSLSSGVDVSPSDTDMRALWWSGEAERVFPSLFGLRDAPPSTLGRFWSSTKAGSAGVLDEFVAHARSVGLKFYRTVLSETPASCVVRCVSDRILPLDDEYFPRLLRFEDWRGFTGHPTPVAYHGPLFM